MSGGRTATEEDLSAECTLAKEPGYEDLHTRCRRMRDIPLPHSNGRLFLLRCCPCACHTPTGGGER